NTLFKEVLLRLSRRTDVSILVQLPRELEGTLGDMRIQVWRQPALLPTGLSWKLDNIVLKRINAFATQLRSWKFARKSWPYVFQSTFFTVTPDAVPQVAIAHDLNHEIFSEFYEHPWGRWLRACYRESIETATRVIAVSENTKNDVIRIYGIPPEKIDVVHLA